jgi:hypothetical protein
VANIIAGFSNDWAEVQVVVDLSSNIRRSIRQIQVTSSAMRDILLLSIADGRLLPLCAAPGLASCSDRLSIMNPHRYTWHYIVRCCGHGRGQHRN